MNQPNMSVVIGSAIALLTAMQPAYGAVPQPNQLEEATQMSLRIPTPPREDGNIGTRGGDVYAIVPRQMEGMDVIWRDRPLLIWDVNRANPVEVTLVKIYDAATGTQLWSQSVKPTDRCVAYTGEPLQPGGRYELWLCDSKSTLLPGGRVQFQMLEPEEHGRVATELDRQVSRLQSQGATVATLTQTQANLFANQRLWADALMAIFSPDNVPESLALARQFIEDLEHINRWLEIATFTGNSSHPDTEKTLIQILTNRESQAIEVYQSQPMKGLKDLLTKALGAPKNSLRTVKAVEPEAIDKPQESYEFSYEYNSIESKWEKPSFRIKLTNTSRDTLYLALLKLTDNFSIKSLLPQGTIQLKPGEADWLNEGEPVYGFVPDDLWEQGITVSQGIYKVIACTADFNPNSLTQGELNDAITRQRSAGRAKVTLEKTLDDMLEKPWSRENKKPAHVKWFSSQVAFTFVRPL